MIEIRLPYAPSRILPFYLAAEEWVASELPDGEYFFAWQVAPSVICGRHQLMNSEVDLDYCRRASVMVWRRRSGGGCVYADLDNVMFSYVTPSAGVQTSFDRYTAMVSDMLRSLGLEAYPGGRNDVEIAGMKVAGNAYYNVPGHSIVHGTMLYDADFTAMSRALTPSRAKLAARGVGSVPSRVTTLRAHGLTISCREFIDYAVSYLCRDGVVVVDDSQIVRINEIMQGYMSPEFYNDCTSTAMVPQRIEGAGEFACDIVVTTDGRIAGCRLSGDFFAHDDIQTVVCDKLAGCEASHEAIASILERMDIPALIPGMDATKLAGIISQAIDCLEHKETNPHKPK